MCSQVVASFHRRSHVLPDWMFKKSYSKDHKLIHIDMNKLTAAKKQSATHGSFWCENCETQSSRFDTYSSLILTDDSPKSSERLSITKKLLKPWDKNNPGIELWSGVDFKRFQSFVFACVIRGELFARSEGRSIVEAKHFTSIHSKYSNAAEIDDKTYPILVSRSPDDDERQQWGFLPHKTKLFNHDGVMFRGGGYQVQIYTSDLAIPRDVTIGSLNQHGEMPVIVDYYKNTGSHKKSLDRLAVVTKNYPVERLSRKTRGKK